MNVEDVCPILEAKGKSRPSYATNKTKGSDPSVDKEYRVSSYLVQGEPEGDEEDEMVARIVGDSYNNMNPGRNVRVTMGPPTELPRGKRSLRITNRKAREYSRNQSEFASGLTPQVHSLGLSDNYFISPGLEMLSPYSDGTPAKATPANFSMGSHGGMIGIIINFPLKSHKFLSDFSGNRHRNRYVPSGMTPACNNDSPIEFINNETPLSNVSMRSIFSLSHVLSSRDHVDSLTKSLNVSLSEVKSSGTHFFFISTSICNVCCLLASAFDRSLLNDELLQSEYISLLLFQFEIIEC